MLMCFTDSSALFLAGNAFINPFEHLSHEETKRMVQGYLAYLNDNTGLISNPGIKVNRCFLFTNSWGF